MGGAGVGGDRGVGGRAVAGWGALLSPWKPLLMLLGPM